MIQKTLDKIESQRLENANLLAENTEQKQLIKELKTFLIPLIPLLKAARLTVVAEHGELLLTKAKAHV